MSEKKRASVECGPETWNTEMWVENDFQQLLVNRHLAKVKMFDQFNNSPLNCYAFTLIGKERLEELACMLDKIMPFLDRRDILKAGFSKSGFALSGEQPHILEQSP